jgi:predicted transcriptional regulator of viral defense system
VILESESYDNEKRFVWGRPSPYSVALSLRNRSYLTHLSAMFLHELTDLTPKIIYVNFEQSPKPQGGNLTQEGIDRAFANRPRQSNLIFKYEKIQMVVINGKFTGRLGVVTLPGAGGELLNTTSLERTLIDIVVRPVYAGDASRILEAFEKAKDKVSINTLMSTLKKLDYVYPYHQAIGFLMERAGYPESKWSKLLRLGTSFDFYLGYQLSKKKKYDSKWRLFYPSGFYFSSI